MRVDRYCTVIHPFPEILLYTDLANLPKRSIEMIALAFGVHLNDENGMILRSGFEY